MAIWGVLNKKNRLVGLFQKSSSNNKNKAFKGNDKKVSERQNQRSMLGKAKLPKRI